MLHPNLIGLLVCLVYQLHHFHYIPVHTTLLVSNDFKPYMYNRVMPYKPTQNAMGYSKFPCTRMGSQPAAESSHSCAYTLEAMI